MDVRRAFILAIVGGLVPSRPAAAGPAAVRTRAVPGRAGLTVTYEPVTLHGLPVRRAFRTVLHTPSGARVLLSRRPRGTPALRPAAARLTADEALARAGAALGLAAPPKVERAPQLVYVDVLGYPVLAWEIPTALVTRPEPSRKTLWIGAATGVLVAEREEVASSRARVFLHNPVVHPEPVDVTLAEIEAEGPGVPLISTRLRAMNCTLEEPEDPDLIEPWWDEGECYAVQRTMSDENGDFFVPLPDVKYPEQNIDGDDLYAELSLYVHAERFFAELAGRGVTTFPCEFSTMLANFRYADPAVSYPELPFGPLNNAYYTNQCDPEKGVTMLFGQGSAIDFAYDGDVVYHELGHGVTSDLTPDGLWDSTYREDGFLRDARGINEAVADYLSAMVTGDPYLADYVGRYWPSYSRPYIRSARNQKRCPDHTIGQEHNDGEPLMGAMWTTREQVGAAFDEVVLAMLPRLAHDATLEQAAEALLAEMDARVADGIFTDEDRAVLFRALSSRGLLDCPRVVTDPAQVAAGRSIWLRRKTSGVEPFLPGPIQIRHEIPPGSDNLILTYKLRPRGTSTGNPIEEEVSARVLVKYGDTPIAYTYDLVAKLPEDEAKEVVLVTGDWDESYVASPLTDTLRQLILRGLRPGDVVHLALVNDGSKADAVAETVRVVSVPSDELDHGVGPDGGAGDAGEPPKPTEPPVEQDEAATASCACRAGTGAPDRGAPAGLVVAGAGAAVRRRRRRR